MYRFKVAGASLVMLVSLFFGASSPATAGETGWGLVGTASADLGTPPTPSKADTAAQGKSGVKGYPGKSVGSTTKASKAFAWSAACTKSSSVSIFVRPDPIRSNPP